MACRGAVVINSNPDAVYKPSLNEAAYVSVYHVDGRLRRRLPESSTGNWLPWS